MPEHAIENLPKGAFPDLTDDRDLLASFVLGAISVDWQRGFQLPEPPNEDQGGSSSCVAQAYSYYQWQLNRKDWSRRSLYSRIFLPEGGAYLRDGMLEIKNRGQALRSSAPDPRPQTEANMRNRADITAEMELIGQSLGGFMVDNKSIDGIADAIEKNKGVVFGLQGNNAGWRDLANPRPPGPGETIEWGHAIKGFGYHLHNGQKCILAKSSWCNTGVTIHHIKQNYFESGLTFNGWTLIPKEQLPMYNRYVVFHKPTGRKGVLVVGQTGFSDSIIWAKSEAMFIQLCQQFEVNPSGPVVTLE